MVLLYYIYISFYLYFLGGYIVEVQISHTSFIIDFYIIFPNNFECTQWSRDELGGHFRRADCVYLLHNPTPLAESAKNIKELIALIKQNNSNSQCVSNLPASTVDLEGYTFPSATKAPVTTKPKATAPKPWHLNRPLHPL